MTVEEKFYLLTLDEVRQQPGLAEELPFDLEQHAERFTGRRLDVAIDQLDRPRPCASGLGFGALAKLPPQPPPLVEELDALRARMDEDPRQSYDRLCRTALLNLLWRDFARAEARINLAKFLRDRWAFAHFLYGLLRGIDGEAGKAHFELYLAVNREGLLCARQRIDRALDLVR